MSSIDRRRGSGEAPRALGAASSSAHPSSSESDQAGAGADSRTQDYGWSRSYSAGSGPQYGVPGGSGQSQYGVPDWYANPQYGEPGGSGPQYGVPGGSGQSQYGVPDWYTNPQYGEPGGYASPQYGEPGGYGRFESGPGGSPQPPRQMVIVVLLALFAGLFGLHNFYLGYTNRGLAQLLITVCTLGLGAPIVWIWAIAELVLIVGHSGSYAFDAFGRPLV